MEALQNKSPPTMVCVKCKREVPAAPFCCQCGAAQQETPRKPKARGNGQGTVYRRGDKYVAVRTLGYYIGDDGRQLRRTVSRTFTRKKDAVAALPTLGRTDTAPRNVSFQEVYRQWFPTCRAGKSTRGCYQAAFKHYAPLYHVPAAEVGIDDLQECIDECPAGKRTRQLMKTVVGLIYKYGVPRGYFPDKLILSDYLTVSAEDGFGGVGLPDAYLAAIRDAIDTVAGAELIYVHCYLGFRPSELLALRKEDYDPAQRAFTGGAKTEAGKDRTVTVSPKIQPIVDAYAARQHAQFFSPDGSALSLAEYRKFFYSVLDALGLDNPTRDVNGTKRHLYTPHSCRHTFATLMKRVDAAGADKLKLIGHTSDEMLRYYQDVPIEDLRKITDQI